MPIITGQNEATIIRETVVTHILDVTQQQNLVAASAVIPLGGASVDPTVVTKTAGQSISGHRMVMLDAVGKLTYPSSATPSHAGVVYGMSLGAAVLNDPVQVKTYGDVTDVSFAWTPNVPLYLNGVGVISETPATTGFTLQIGYSTGITSMFIDLKQPIVLV